MDEHGLCLVDGREDSDALVEAVIQRLHPHRVQLILILSFVVLDD